MSYVAQVRPVVDPPLGEGSDLRRVELTAGTVCYREAGHGPVIVFVHGVFMNGLLWSDVARPLAADFRCIVPDLPLGAHEPAMRPGADLTPAGVAATLLEFLTALDLEEVTLVGSDTGTALCQLAIAAGSKRIARLVLTNGDSFENFFPPVLAPFTVLPRIPGFVWLFAQCMRPLAARRLFARTVAKRFTDRATLDALFAPVWRDAGVRRDLRRFLTSVSKRYTLEAAQSFAGFARPVLVVWGQDDLFFPARDGERLAKSFPNARLERIADSRTFVPADQPAKLAASIAEFVGTRVPA
jgi:pimeloyl-ACP methyl ester carboxylesterase